MKNFYKKKKLLILGANQETVPLIETAKNMGVFVYVTDHNPDAFAKKYADKPCNIDGLDVQGLIELVKQEKINGVLVGVADRLIVPYQKVCSALKLPCYADEAQSRILTDKQYFNEACERNGISTIPSILIDKAHTDYDLKNLSYPVFVKPVDGNSGKGMSICYTKEELEKGVRKAREVSASGRILVERYMQCADTLINYTIIDGEVFLSAMADRYTSNEQGKGSRVCIGAYYPSKHLNSFLEKYHNKFVAFFQSIGLRNGVFSFCAFVEDDEFYVYDPGFRLQGEAPDVHLLAVNGFDQKEILIRLALTGRMGKYDAKKVGNCKFQNNFNATIWFLAKKGLISRIEGLSEIQKDVSVIKVAQRLKVADEITAEMEGTEAQVVARIYLSSCNKQQLIDKVDLIQKLFKVYDVNNDYMLLQGFDSTLIK